MKKFLEKHMGFFVAMFMLIIGVFMIYYGYSGNEWHHLGCKFNGFWLAPLGALGTISNMI